MRHFKKIVESQHKRDQEELEKEQERCYAGGFETGKEEARIIFQKQKQEMWEDCVRYYCGAPEPTINELKSKCGVK